MPNGRIWKIWVTGVEEVTTDSKASKVVVKGKAADPSKVCERLQKKSGRKVELISPLPKPPEEKKEEAKDPPKEEEKKDEVKISKILLLSTHNHYHLFTYLIFFQLQVSPHSLFLTR
jgi:hypothetical protein